MLFNNWSTKLKVKLSGFTRKHSSGFVKVIFVLIIMAICFIPSYIGLFFWWLISPSGFWQTFATVALLLTVFGSTQVIALIFGVIIVISVLVERL